MSTKQQTTNKEPKRKLIALTLIETIVSMTLMAVIFLTVMQAFNSILLGSYMIDARTAVRNEGEFITEYFRLYLKNADPRTLSCTQDTNYPSNPAILKLKWQPLGTADTYQFFYNTAFIPGTSDQYGRFTLTQNGKEVILSYPDVNIRPETVAIQCDSFTDSLTGQTINTVSLKFSIDSALQLAGRPAVKDVPRNVTVITK